MPEPNKLLHPDFKELDLGAEYVVICVSSVYFECVNIKTETTCEVWMVHDVTFPIFSFCVDSWFRQHEYIEKLNMQAILDASALHDEFVKELLVSYGKVTFL